MKTTITLYIFQVPGEAQRVYTADMSGWPEVFGALLGTQDFEVEWQEVDANPVDILLQRYDEEMTRIHDELSERGRVIGERITALLRFDHDTGRTFE